MASVMGVSEAKTEEALAEWASAEEAEMAVMELQYWSLRNWTTGQPPKPHIIFPSNSSTVNKNYVIIITILIKQQENLIIIN